MYFVAIGTAEIVNERENVDLSHFSPGSFFGEVGLFFHVPRTVSIRCVSTTITLFKLTKDDLEKTVGVFPEMKEKIYGEAKKRFEFNEMRRKANLNTKQTFETEIEVIRERLKMVCSSTIQRVVLLGRFRVSRLSPSPF